MINREILEIGERGKHESALFVYFAWFADFTNISVLRG
jgi:hypothetical protein